MATYTVKAGDSLSMIAEHVLGHTSLWPEIAKLNHIGFPDRIYPGQILQLPGSKSSSSVLHTLSKIKSSSLADHRASASWLSSHRMSVGLGLLTVGILGFLYSQRN